MLALIEQHRDALSALCAKYGVARLDVFGSAATGEFDSARSDLDFLLTFDPEDSGNLFDRFFGLHADLESLFGRKVDLVTERSIRNPFFRDGVEATRVNIYAA